MNWLSFESYLRERRPRRERVAAYIHNNGIIPLVLGVFVFLGSCFIAESIFKNFTPWIALLCLAVTIGACFPISWCTDTLSRKHYQRFENRVDKAKKDSKKWHEQFNRDGGDALTEEQQELVQLRISIIRQHKREREEGGVL